MGHNSNSRAIHTIHRQLASCLFLFGFFLMGVRPAAAQTVAPASQPPLIPLETWVMMGVVMVGLLALAFKLFHGRNMTNN